MRKEDFWKTYFYYEDNGEKNKARMFFISYFITEYMKMVVYLGVFAKIVWLCTDKVIGYIL